MCDTSRMSFTYNEQTPYPISEVDSDLFSSISDERLPMTYEWNAHDKTNINDIDLGNDQDQAMEHCNDTIEREINCITDCMSIHDILCKSIGECLCSLQKTDKQAKPRKDNSHCDERQAIENFPDLQEQPETLAFTKLSRAPSDGWNRLEGATLRNISFRHVFGRENEAKSENKTNKPNKIDATLSCGGVNHKHAENKHFRKPAHNLKRDYNKRKKNDANIVNKPDKELAKPRKDNSHCDERKAIENFPDLLEQTEIPACTKLSCAPSDGWNRLEGATLRNISFRHVFDRENEAKSENKTNIPNKIDATHNFGGLNHQHIENKRFRKPTHNLKGDYNKSNKNDSNIVNKPNKADVVFGRGGLANNHTGNKRFRTLVYDHKDEYDKSSKKAKTTISQSVVDAITSDGGRFLRRDKSTCTWLTVDNSEARRKTSQALRDASIFNTCEGKTETNEI